MWWSAFLPGVEQYTIDLLMDDAMSGCIVSCWVWSLLALLSRRTLPCERVLGELAGGRYLTMHSSDDVPHRRRRGASRTWVTSPRHYSQSPDDAIVHSTSLNALLQIGPHFLLLLLLLLLLLPIITIIIIGPTAQRNDCSGWYYSVAVNVLWKETAFPPWRPMDRRWNENVVSLIIRYQT